MPHFLRERRPADAIWQVVLALIARAPDDDAVGAVAAGPLEDIAIHHGAQFGDRLVEETRSDPRFRTAIRGILGWDRVPEPYRSRLIALLQTPEGRRESSTRTPHDWSG
jgi:hypothetical protein